MATSTRAQAISEALHRPVQPQSLRFFRAAFGALLAIEAGRFFTNGWIDSHLTGPGFHFTYAGFGWVRPLPGVGMYVVLAILGVVGALLAVGRWPRAMAALSAVGWAWILLIDRALYLNHHYLVIVICTLLALGPGLGRRGVPPTWLLYALRALLVIVYFWAGVSKLDSDWFAGAPLWLTLQGVVVPPWLAVLQGWPAAITASWGILLLELATPVVLVFRWTRPVAIALYVVFHLVTVPLYDIGIFPFLSLALLSLWLPPSWPRRVLVRRRAPDSPPPTRTPTLLVFAVGAFLVVQAVLPLRPWLDAGNPSWTMSSSRLSWRLLTAHKSGWVRFVLEDRATGATTEVSPLTFLTPWQAGKMGRDPWMILDFARWLAAEQARRGLPPVAVRALTGASLNGRPPVPLVQPWIDLARVRGDAAPLSWIAPLREPLPDHPTGLDPATWLAEMRGPQWYADAIAQRVGEGELRDAARYIPPLLALDPASDAPLPVVLAHRSQGRDDEALVVLDTWLSSAPHARSALLQRGEIHAAAGRDALARPALEEAVRIAPDAGAMGMLGRIAAARGDVAEAERWFRASFDTDPTSIPSALHLAEILARHLSRPADAIAVLDRCAARVQDPTQLDRMRARILDEAGQSPSDASRARD